jgi:methyl coenzyme M reductase subunit C
MAPSVADVTEYVGELKSHVSYVLHILPHEDAATIVVTHPPLDYVDRKKVRTPVRQ